MYMRITSKQQFFSLWEAGVLGNRTRLWRDPLDAFEWGRNNSNFRAYENGCWSQHPDLPEIGFREIRKSGTAGAGAWEKVPWHRALETAERWRAAGRNFVMDDGAPDDKRTLQGEVCRTHRGLESYLEVGGGLPMRPAMAAGLMKHRGYVETKVLLDRYMDPSSRDDLDMMLDLYSDHTIEFSCFSVDVGIFPGRNVIFWETRLF
jgi:hypothetical protein